MSEVFIHGCDIMKKSKIDAGRLADLRDQVNAARKKCDQVRAEPHRRGFWDTLFHYVAIIPAVVELIGGLIDLLEGEN